MHRALALESASERVVAQHAMDAFCKVLVSVHVHSDTGIANDFR